ncbi:MAG TPA: hypothetical protein VMY16_14040 [Ilumatobacteraceae bacterium]|nr:hypothetical protein [Ilumatobacteraceae bacterium]
MCWATSSAWTAAQVEQGRRFSIDELAAEWEQEGQQFEDELRRHAAGSVIIDLGDETLMLGSGTPVIGLTTTRLELFRALGGRRTSNEIAALDWSVTGPAIDLVNCYDEPSLRLDEQKHL